MNPVNVLIAVQAVAELSGLIARAIEAGEDITDAQLAAVFAKCDRADAAWADANAARGESEHGATDTTEAADETRQS